MSGPARDPMPWSDRVMVGLGLVLTGVWLSGVRPWGNDLPLANLALLLGPILLVVVAASRSARGAGGGGGEKAARAGRPAGSVVRTGLVMLLIGGCPWVYTPLLTGGEQNQASGMLGTLIFLGIGLPGLGVFLIGLIHWVRQRRSRGKPAPDPEV